jgi:NADH-quinone oxidoreductase subunit G
MRLTIDGRALELPAGATVLDGVNQLGLSLPQLCKDPDRAPLGACRTCLVHVEGQRGTPAACHLPAREGMIVDTQHPEAARVRRTVLDLTLSMLTPSANGGAVPGLHRDGFGQVSEAWTRHGGQQPSWSPLHRFEPDTSKSFFILDREACILCGRCTVACDEVQLIGAITLAGRGDHCRVGVFGDGPMASSVCTSCGQCVATCPTGALRPKEIPAAITRRVETTCPYCGVGCSLELHVQDNRIVKVTSPSDHDITLGNLCIKGRFGFTHVQS